jgi:hypothetical protein
MEILYSGICDAENSMLRVQTSITERERGEEEESWGVVRDTIVLEGGCKRNIIWQFGRFPGSAR